MVFRFSLPGQAPASMVLSGPCSRPCGKAGRVPRRRFCRRSPVMDGAAYAILRWAQLSRVVWDEQSGRSEGFTTRKKKRGAERIGAASRGGTRTDVKGKMMRHFTPVRLPSPWAETLPAARGFPVAPMNPLGAAYSLTVAAVVTLERPQGGMLWRSVQARSVGSGGSASLSSHSCTKFLAFSCRSSRSACSHCSIS